MYLFNTPVEVAIAHHVIHTSLVDHPEAVKLSLLGFQLLQHSHLVMTSL